MGIFDGRQSMFQAGFDNGYENGFKNAHNIGYHQGLVAAMKQMDSNRVPDSCLECIEQNRLDLLLAKPTRGQCQICLDKNLVNESIGQVVNVQNMHCLKVNEALDEKYRGLKEFLNNPI